MNRSLYITTCALVFIGLFGVGLWFYRPRIEADLTLRTTEALRKAALAVKSVRFEGRDGFIEMGSGDAGAGREKAARVFGVRKVKVRSEATHTASPRLRLLRVGEVLRLSGLVASEEKRSALEAQVRGLFEDFKVETAWENPEPVSDPSYLSELGGLFRLLASIGPEGKLVLENARIEVSGEVASEESRLEITAAARAALPQGLELSLDLRAPAMAPPRKVAQAISSSRFFFEFDSVQLTKESAAEAANVVSALKSAPSPLRIIGHTDSIGTKAYNQSLSLRRATKVREIFQSEGFSLRTEVIGFGENRAVATNETAEGRAQNRRVEFEVIGGG